MAVTHTSTLQMREIRMRSYQGNWNTKLLHLENFPLLCDRPLIAYKLENFTMPWQQTFHSDAARQRGDGDAYLQLIRVFTWSVLTYPIRTVLHIKDNRTVTETLDGVMSRCRPAGAIISRRRLRRRFTMSNRVRDFWLKSGRAFCCNPCTA
jgi:hypothetical protein